MKLFIDMTGKTFGRLIVLQRCAPEKNKSLKWICQCNCGNICHVLSNSLRMGKTTSCGCLKNELTVIRSTTHGKTKSTEYRSWFNIKNRCHNKLNPHYKNYGGRGIFMCERWINSFINFFEDMGEKPNKSYSIERVNNNKGYSPENCIWASRKKQNDNRRNTYWIEHNGKRMTITDWTRELDCCRSTCIIYFLKKGKSFDWIVNYYSNPNRKRKNKKIKLIPDAV